ncbi:hypothetical protein PPSIR1_06863 [Plesiocystis pacifica SIR-1]|uniref:Sulfotransferase family protein n=1 Tax=Plesiocystis pacifica SIR-1 TaxID=391625 RepID=A6G531_9BACT|nr:hypothetical protein PPSIR1_06863 [Plesiocystis pacifica SIR-1]
MIFVSGTKRSGTSMWMQVLAAAGVPILGRAFPRNWARTLREANPEGFYESLLRQGVYYRTNPHPTTGEYFLPDQVEGYAVKVFVPGVVRSERAYIRRLVANVRAWRDYAASMARLHALEDRAMAEAAARSAEAEPSPSEPVRFPPVFEWWMENFALVRDISLRRYPARLQAYDRVVDAPAQILGPALEWLGVPDIDAGLAAVRPELRTQVDSELALEAAPELPLEPRHARVFDELYAAIHDGAALDGALLSTLNQTNRELLPRLRQVQAKVAAYQVRVSRANPRRAEAVAGLPECSSGAGPLTDP